MFRLMEAFAAGILFIGGVAHGQIRQNPDSAREVEYRSAEGRQVLKIDFNRSTMTLRTGDAAARWSLSLTPNDLGWAEYWVHNDGWVVRVKENDLVTVREPERGESVYSVSLLQTFAKRGEGKHVHEVTDRPPKWETHAIWAFREADGAPYFVVRPWWGNRVLIDLRGRGLVEDAGAVHDAVVRQEAEWVLGVLRESAAMPCPDDREPRKNWSIVHRARKAAHLAGLLKLPLAAEPLRELEKWTYDDTSVFVPGGTEDDAGFNPFHHRVNTLRQAAQLSLRRLGEAPAQSGAVSFDRFHADRLGGERFERVVFSRPREPRAAAMKSVRVGMSGKQVGEILGGPDGFVKGAWEYDVEGTDPHTIRISWKAGYVAEIERIAARWLTGTVRDEEVVY